MRKHGTQTGAILWLLSTTPTASSVPWLSHCKIQPEAGRYSQRQLATSVKYQGTDNGKAARQCALPRLWTEVAPSVSGSLPVAHSVSGITCISVDYPLDSY